jgi:hypothetical protein
MTPFSLYPGKVFGLQRGEIWIGPQSAPIGAGAALDG